MKNTTKDTNPSKKQSSLEKRSIKAEEKKEKEKMKVERETIELEREKVELEREKVELEKMKVEKEKIELEKETISVEQKLSKKNSVLYFWLMFFFGRFGIHKFYVKKYILGVLYILTGGFFGIGNLIDIINFSGGKINTTQGQYLEVSYRYTIFAKVLLVLIYVLHVMALIFTLLFVTRVLVELYQSNDFRLILESIIDEL